MINMIGLAVGLSCCMLIVLYTKDENSFDRFQENKDRLHRVVVTISDQKESNKIGSTNSIHGPSFKMEIPEIEDIVRVQSSSFVSKLGNDLVNENVIFADPNFFKVFSFPLIEGSADQSLADVNSIVLSEDMAEKYFHTTDALGKTISLKINDNFETFKVTGVAENCPENSSVQFNAVLSFKFQESRGWLNNEWLGFYMNTFVLLHKNADYLKVAPKLDKVFASKSAEEISKIKDFKQTFHFDLQPFLSIHLGEDIKDMYNGLEYGSKPIYSYILSGIAIFILVIACINFVNLTIARSLKRSKEIGIRKVVGGLRKQLIIQFLSESFMLSFLAFSLAIAITLLVLPSFNELANKRLSLSYLFDFKLVAGYIGLFFLTGLLVGFYPALVLSGFDPVATLYSRSKFTSKNFLTRGLVVFQFTLSICLVIGTVVVYSQFKYLLNKDLGYNDKNLLSFSLGRGGAGREKLKLVREEVEKLAGVASVAAFNGNYNGTVAKVGENEVSFGYIGVDDNFVPNLEIPLVDGRNFSQKFGADPVESVIVNEAFAKEVGWKNPVGQEIDFTWKNQKMKVIGVVKDYHYKSLKEEIKPLLMTQDPNYGLGTIYARLRPEDIPGTIKKIEKIFRSHVTLMPFEYKFEAETNRQRYESEAKWTQMITLAAVISIFVSCIGLFGLATFSAEVRTKEMGIRKVMGASSAAIVRLLTVDFLLLVCIAIFFATPLAYFGAEKWLENFPYREAISIWYFLFASVVAVFVAMLTVGYQSVRTALINPVNSLRSE